MSASAVAVRTLSLGDAIAQFRNAIHAAGIELPEEIEADGRLHRFSANGQRNDDAGWYVFHADNIPAGAFGDWRTGVSQTWHANIAWRLSPVEEATHRARIQAMQREREAEETQRRAEAREKAAAIWKAAKPATEHPYLTAKGIKPHGLRVHNGSLVVPMRDGAELHSLQFISDEGEKRFLAGGRVSGCYFPIGKPNGVLCIAEGYATAESIHEATSYAVAVAFNAGNLKPVAETLRGKYPEARIIVCADDDASTSDNPGLAKAREAAQAVGRQLAVPDFGESRPGDATDFNDMAKLRGLEAVRTCIEQAVTVEAVAVATATPDWPEPKPLPDRLPPVPAFKPLLLPEALRPWIEDIAERMQCPIEFPATGAMVSLASLVGRRVTIRPKRHDDWTVVPNLWGAVVGRPGLLKTPALAEAMRPLSRLIAEAEKEHSRKMVEFMALKDEHEAREKVLGSELRGALKGKGERNKDSILADMQELRAKQGEPKARRLLTNDCTVEKLGELLSVNPNGLLVFRDELTAWLRSLDRDGHEGDRGFYLEAWDGNGSFVYDRIGRGTVHIEAACVSMLGTIQPGPLSDYVRGAASGGAGADGLLQRFQILLYPDDPGVWRNVDRWPNTDAKTDAFRVFERLANLDAEAIGAHRDNDQGLPYLRFDETAQAAFDEWRAELEKKLRGDEAEYFEAHLSKYRKLVPAIALLLHLAGNENGGPIGESAMLMAAAWAEFLEAHARRVYAEALNPGISAAHEMARRIKAGDLPAAFAVRDAYRNGWHRLDRAGLLQAVDRLEALGWLKVDEIETGGRRSATCTVNPRVRA